MAITQEKNIEMLEKLADGNFKIKYPKTNISQVIGLEATFAKISSSLKLARGEFSATGIAIGKEPEYTEIGRANVGFVPKFVRLYSVASYSTDLGKATIGLGFVDDSGKNSMFTGASFFSNYAAAMRSRIIEDNRIGTAMIVVEISEKQLVFKAGASGYGYEIYASAPIYWEAIGI